MHIEATNTFIKFYKKLSEGLKERTKKALQLLESNPDAVSAVSNYQNLFEGKKYTVKKHNFNEQETNNLNRTVNSLLHFIITNNLSYFYGLHPVCT